MEGWNLGIAVELCAVVVDGGRRDLPVIPDLSSLSAGYDVRLITDKLSTQKGLGRFPPPVIYAHECSSVFAGQTKIRPIHLDWQIKALFCNYKSYLLVHQQYGTQKRS